MGRLDRHAEQLLERDRIGRDPDAIRDHANRLEEAAEQANTRSQAEGMLEHAERLRAIALKLEEDDAAGDDDSSSSSDDDEQPGYPLPTRPFRELRDNPVTGGTARSAAQLFWTAVAVTLALVIVYWALTSATAASKLLGGLSGALSAFINQGSAGGTRQPTSLAGGSSSSSTPVRTQTTTRPAAHPANNNGALKGAASV